MLFSKTFLTLLITSSLYAGHTSSMPLPVHETTNKPALYCSEPNGVTLYTLTTRPEQGIEISCFETEKEAHRFYTTMLHTKQILNTAVMWVAVIFAILFISALLYDFLFFFKHGKNNNDVYTLKKPNTSKKRTH